MQYATTVTVYAFIIDRWTVVREMTGFLADRLETPSDNELRSWRAMGIDAYKAYACRL